MVVAGSRFVCESFLIVAVVTFGDIGVMLALFEMTDETGTLGNRDVFSLNDLGMTACALKLFPSFEVLKMDFVVERDIIELHLAFQEPFFMAAFS